MPSRFLAASLAVTVLLGFADRTPAQGWGGFKGQVVWNAKDAIPVRGPVDVTGTDKPVCLKNGPIQSDILLIDAKSRGIANTMVWLIPMKAGDKIPIHPDLEAVPKADVVIDQPCCMFEPRVTMMREGQKLVIKNTSAISHNANYAGRKLTFNPNIPPGGSYTKEMIAEPRPVILSCGVHGWMKARVCVFAHPYFALTKADGTFEIRNAPAGKFKLLVSHELAGWLHAGREPSGQEIVVKANQTLDLGKFEMTKKMLEQP